MCSFTACIIGISAHAVKSQILDNYLLKTSFTCFKKLGKKFKTTPSKEKKTGQKTLKRKL